MTEEALPSGLGRAAWSTRYMCGFLPAGRQWLQSGCLAGRPIQGSLLIPSMGSLLQGLPRNSPEYILGTNLGKRLLVPVGQCQTWIAPKWCIKSDNGHCQVRQSCRCSMLAAEFSGLNWMTKLFWTAILCYRKASFAMFSRRSVQLHGRALQVKGLRSPLCCRAVKMQMTGLISCCRKRTYGPPLQPGGLLERRFPKKPFVKSGAGCRPSIYGWRSSWAGTCWLTGCTQRPQLESHVNNFMHCFSTRLPGAAKRIPMKKKHTVDLHLKQSRHGGSNAKSGCYTSKVKVRHWSRTCRDFYRLSGARKKLLVLR